jgi:hypothetical protein
MRAHAASWGVAAIFLYSFLADGGGSVPPTERTRALVVAILVLGVGMMGATIGMLVCSLKVWQGGEEWLGGLSFFTWTAILAQGLSLWLLTNAPSFQPSALDFALMALYIYVAVLAHNARRTWA